MRQKTDQKFYLGSWGGKFSLLSFAKAESATILFSPFQNTWSGKWAVKLEFMLHKHVKICHSDWAKKVGKYTCGLQLSPSPPALPQAGCWNSGKVGKYLQYLQLPPSPPTGCRNSGMQADVRANTGQWGMRLSRREKSGRYWNVKESALRKLSQNM